jgi:antitoxin PrlF
MRKPSYTDAAGRTRLLGDVMSRRKMTRKGRVTIPKKMRDVLRLNAGDIIEFELSATGDILMRKAPVSAQDHPPRRRAVRPRVEAQVRLRAAELLALLRGLD